MHKDVWEVPWCLHVMNQVRNLFFSLYSANSITLRSILYNLQLLKLNLWAVRPIQSHEWKKGKTKTTASKDLSIQTTIWSTFPWKSNAYTPLETFPTLFPCLRLKSFIFWLPPNAGRGWNSFSHNSPLKSDLTLADRAQVHSRGWTELVFQRPDPHGPCRPPSLAAL